MDNPYCSPEIWGGIECTINRVRNAFHDQLAYGGHYEREADMEALASLGIRKIRYPILWEKHQPVKNGVIDWSWIERRLDLLASRKVDVIAGLVHHGSGPSYTSLADKNFPQLLASYARQVAEKFPSVNYFTPVNEPLTTARFSGLYGIWYPHHRNARSFMQMLLNQLKGVVLSMQEIRKVNPGAKLVQTEDLGKTYSTPRLAYQARFENERRWLTYDILCGRFNEKHKLWKFFTGLIIKKSDFHFFLDNPCPPDIFGFNHYLTSERYLDHRLQLYPQHTHGGNRCHRYADVEAVRVELEEETGIEVLLREAWDRYKKPLAVTEVHLHCTREEQLRWFRHVWQTGKKLVAEGIDLKAITSWAMLGSYGWNRLLTSPGGDYEPGAFDLRGGIPRPTALANFIKEIALHDQCEHLLSSGKGWWQRNARILYGPVIREVRTGHTLSSHPPLLIIGKNGTLGKAFARVCEERGLAFELLSRQDCDISKPEDIANTLSRLKPWAIINTAGYVRVDEAEGDSEACLRDNTYGPVNLAAACADTGIRLVCFSSDLVFDGSKQRPYIETDPATALNVYGRSKALMETLVMEKLSHALVIRTSAFFGPWDEYNFVHYVRKALGNDEVVRVANDILISPTYVPHLVNAALDLLIDGETGIWHLANQGEISWAGLAAEVAERFELDKSLIQSLSSAELGYPAPRPAYSVLGSTRGHLLPALEQALDEYMAVNKTVKKKVA
ncbi:MAG TPA: family 1 glycosylhydrolase [Flavisolibacter sp.]|nr:family 1 glycosylhydrolase [Flavisolibacter sp.]